MPSDDGLVLQSPLTIATSLLHQPTRLDYLFVFLFLFRYLRFVVHTITGLFLYKPARPANGKRPRYTNRHVAVIIPTVAPNTAAFLRCCESILANAPLVLVISTVGVKLKEDVEAMLAANHLRARFPRTDFRVVKLDEANKRRQILRASDGLDKDATPVTVCVDDSAFWGPRFLEALLPAFDDPRVGLVGTNKKVLRDATARGSGPWASFTNFIACLYLERHNFQIRSEPYLDGGVFVVSGRTAAMRTEIHQDPGFRRGYAHELYLFGRRGPLNPDDDNYCTRWVLRHGWRVRAQCAGAASTMHTPLGDPRKFYGQLLR